MHNEPLLNALCIFCEKIGADKSIIQGAGGNVSIKIDEIIWVKASGTWLADANWKNIFVPLNLKKIQNDFANCDFEKLKNIGDEYIVEEYKALNLKPSIETLFHAIMPQKIVVHAHSMNSIILSCLENGGQLVHKTNDYNNLVFIDYFKPGLQLAKAIYEKIYKNAKSQIVILNNHGIIIGAQNIKTADDLLYNFEKENEFKNRFIENNIMPNLPINGAQYYYPINGTKDFSNDYFACEILCNKILTPDWAVFLSNGIKFISNDKFNDKNFIYPTNKDAIIVENIGIFANNNLSKNGRAILEIIIEIAMRIPKNAKLKCLNASQIHELQNWDAEKYRKSISV